MAKLKAREKLFCREYLKDFNQGQAYLRAGYACTPESARADACRLMKRPEIQNHISSLIDEHANKLDITINKALALFWKFANANMGDYAEWDKGHPLHLQTKILGSDEVDTSLIQKIGYDPKGGFKLELVDKLAALNAVAKHLGMFIDKKEVSLFGTVNVPDLSGLTTEELKKLANS